MTTSTKQNIKRNIRDFFFIFLFFVCIFFMLRVSNSDRLKESYTLLDHNDIRSFKIDETEYTTKTIKFYHNINSLLKNPSIEGNICGISSEFGFINIDLVHDLVIYYKGNLYINNNLLYEYSKADFLTVLNKCLDQLNLSKELEENNKKSIEKERIENKNSWNK